MRVRQAASRSAQSSSSSARTPFVKSSISRSSSMRAITGGSPARSLRSAVHHVGAVDRDQPRGDRLLGCGAAADHRFARRSTSARRPGTRAQQRFARAGGSRPRVWRIMASAGTASQRSSSRLRSVFSSAW